MAIAAAGSALVYQWMKDGQPLDNTNLSDLTLSNVQLADAGLYRYMVSNAGGPVTSEAVTLKVSVDPVPPALVITKPPVSATVTNGAQATLSVSATGDGLFYQ